jgi:hypothetical protein
MRQPDLEKQSLDIQNKDEMHGNLNNLTEFKAIQDIKIDQKLS